MRHLLFARPVGVAVLIAGLYATNLAQTPVPADSSSLADQLAAVTARGRLLAEYDVAAWHAGDAVQALKPPVSVVDGYVAQKIEKRWVVSFGRLSANRDRYLIAYEATQGRKPESFDVKKLETPREDTGFNWKGVLALDVARKDFQGENRPYNFSVLPADAGQFYVYVMPASTEDKVYPFGGDVRYLVSDDGLTIVEKTQFHKSILVFDYRKAPGKTVGGYHTNILSDIPVDTDVFLVLSRKPSMPELVSARGHNFQINTDGTIVPVKGK